MIKIIMRNYTSNSILTVMPNMVSELCPFKEWNIISRWLFEFCLLYFI